MQHLSFEMKNTFVRVLACSIASSWSSCAMSVPGLLEFTDETEPVPVDIGEEMMDPGQPRKI